MKKVDYKEIVKFAFLKYRLSGRKPMNSFIFSQVRRYKLNEDEIDNLLEMIDDRIEKFEEKENLKNEIFSKDEFDYYTNRITFSGNVV